MNRNVVEEEDIINRGGGKMVMELLNQRNDGRVEEEKEVNVEKDGRIVKKKEGENMKIKKGERVKIMKGNWKDLWGEGGDVMIGEVQNVNEDMKENILREKIGRLQDIEEKEKKLNMIVYD